MENSNEDTCSKFHYVDKSPSIKRKMDYIEVNPRMRVLNTGISLDNKELFSLEQIVKRMSKGKARFGSNVMAIVGEGVRKAEVNAFGNKVKALIPKYIDKIVKTHNTISQEGLNALLYVWVYGSAISASSTNIAPAYLTSGTGAIVFTTTSGTEISFGPAVFVLYNGSNTYTFIFIVNDTSTNSYTVTQEQLFPGAVCNWWLSSRYPYQLTVPLSTANLIVTKSSNQILTFIWAIQINFSSEITIGGAIGLFYPSYKDSFNSSPTTGPFYFVNVNGVLYAMKISTDTSSNAYTQSSVSVGYWGLGSPDISGNGNPGGDWAYLVVTTPPNPPGVKQSYGAMSWYNGFYLTV
jgi:hypothetical protein